MSIRKIWIEEGCISCNLCEDTVSEVFQVRAGDTSRVRKGYIRLLSDPAIVERVHEAAESCPVEVIIVEE
ncbi:MAG TPA: ferredoxin [Planctomycetes bacterium]|nr:ferredoxin [Planctomycetota bacterium]